MSKLNGGGEGEGAKVWIPVSKDGLSRYSKVVTVPRIVLISMNRTREVLKTSFSFSTMNRKMLRKEIPSVNDSCNSKSFLHNLCK